MNCQQCGREAELEAKFCVDCGSPLELRCPACQTPYELGGRFCALCGRSLPDILPPDQSAHSEGGSPDQPRVADQEEITEELSQPIARDLACPRCHQKNTVDSEYCFACGMPLEGIPPELSKHGPQPAPFVDSSIDSLSSAQAGFWVRLSAFTIDIFLASVVVALLVALFANADDSFTALMVSLGYLGYFTVLVAVKATTIGKSFLKLYVVRTDGSRVGIIRAFFRSVAQFLVLAIAWGTLLGVFFLIYHYRKHRRAVHDAICDTMVVKSDRHLL